MSSSAYRLAWITGAVMCAFVLAVGCISVYATVTATMATTTTTTCTTPQEFIRAFRTSVFPGVMLNVKPRRMWGWGLWSETIAGYCGEGSVQTCMIYYGNYVSQEQILKAAGSPFLMGVNHAQCFDSLFLEYEYVGKPAMTLDSILQFVKQHIDAQHPVIMGLYVVEEGGDPSYDHLCPIFGYQSTLDGRSAQTLYLADGYLFYPFELSCLGTDCYQDRKSATPQYSYAAPFQLAIPDVTHTTDKGNPALNQMAAIVGNRDPRGELRPVYLEMNMAYEPNWGSEDQLYMKPCAISCACVIGELEPGSPYSLLRFDNPNDVPRDGGFLQSSTWTVRVDFTAQCESYRLDIADGTQGFPFMSDGTYFFRCVSNTDVEGRVRSKYPRGTNRTDKTRAHLPSMALSAKRIRALERRRKRGASFAASPPFNECSGMTPTDANLTCMLGNDYAGTIATAWKWQWPSKSEQPTTPDYGCMAWTFKTLTQYQSIVTAPVCVAWGMTCEHQDLIGEDGCNGVIGLDGRMYVDCMDNPFLMSWSDGSADSTGSYRMISQDGVTTSVLTPVTTT